MTTTDDTETPGRHEWFVLIRDALRDRVKTVPVDGAAGHVLRTLEEAGLPFPQRGRRPEPQSPEEHLLEAMRLLEMSLTADATQPGGYHADDHALAQVAAAEVHARIAHAWAALSMTPPPRTEDAPGLAALEKLADAVDRLAGPAPGTRPPASPFKRQGED